jgi:hypothetical protein
MTAAMASTPLRDTNGIGGTTPGSNKVERY